MVLLGQLVFEYRIPPSHLEPVAQKLNLNLVYNIVCNCCPKVPSLLPSSDLNFENRHGKNWGKIVLNNSRVSMYMYKSIPLKCSVVFIQITCKEKDIQSITFKVSKLCTCKMKCVKSRVP
jgi:hypothetical protein